MQNTNIENVVKALECCSTLGRPDCKNCPEGDKRGCAVKLHGKSLAAIKILLEKTNTLTIENDRLHTIINENKLSTVN